MNHITVKRALCILFFLPFLLLSTAHSKPKKISVTGIRHWSNPEYTRVVIDLDGRAGYRYRLLKKDPSINKPRRLYVDISLALLGKGLKKAIPINDGLLKKVRVGQYNRKTVRVVLDIESIKKYRIFHLSDPYRIVIDVIGDKKRIPDLKVDGTSDGPTLGQQLGLKVKRIVIDPGHGGKDPGAIGKRGLKEKDVTLKISKLLKKELQKRLNAKIILTRERDVFIPLEERTAIANSKKADLFVSIHVNASPRRRASGVETYFLGLTTDREAMRIAARENATTTKAMSDLEYIIYDLVRTAKTNESSRLASFVQESLVGRLKKGYRDIKSNGVKGAPFWVLIGTNMPSILVEVSFISNPVEEKRLMDERYLKKIAEGISTGILRYIKEGGGIV